MTKTIKKRRAIQLKIADMMDDSVYTDITSEELLTKLKYNMELDPLLKANKHDVEEVQNIVQSLWHKIEEIK